ncbi:MAG: SDR family oxidoreductase [Mangrovicoccus sp.]|nr:SDR family oxidoreductase [Mangrovicoccus sp.]
MKVLVTGHRGYIGSVLVPLLQSAGHEVFGVDSDLYSSCDFGGTPPECAWIRRDIRDLTERDLAGFEAVIHLAGLSNDPLGDIDPSLTDEINTRATIRLGQLAKAAGVGRFLFSSSCSNYGAAGQDWMDETAPLNPVTPYAVSKVVSEEKLDALADSQFTPVYLRSATAYGVSPRIRFDLVVNNLMAWAVATGQVRLKSDGSAWRPLVHIRDIAQAFLCALQADRDAVHRQAFNVGRNDQIFQIKEVAALVKAEVAGSEVTFMPGRIVDERTYRVECSKIKTLGFDPVWTVEKGVKELHEAFRAQAIKTEDFEGPRYMRLAHIRHLLADGCLDRHLRFCESQVA